MVSQDRFEWYQQIYLITVIAIVGVVHGGGDSDDRIAVIVCLTTVTQTYTNDGHHSSLARVGSIGKLTDFEPGTLSIKGVL